MRAGGDTMVAAHAQQLKRLEELQAELDSMQADEKLLAEAALMGTWSPRRRGHFGATRRM